MASRYDKPALAIVQQLDLLRSRGMVIEDDEAARLTLAAVSYYRLSGYWYPFRQVDAAGQRLDTFRDGTTFGQSVALYEFDRRLRLELLDAVERVEIALRTAVTYRFALAAGAFGHVDPTQFRPTFDHADWLRRLEEEIGRSRESFVVHYRTRYDSPPHLPLWMATEVMSFGALSRLFQHLQAPIQREIAGAYGVHHSVLASWMHVVAVVRNLCAHHARIWNRELGVRPKVPERDARWRGVATNRLFGILLILRSMLHAQGAGEQWARRIVALIDPIAALGTNHQSMGLPPQWPQHPVWANP